VDEALKELRRTSGPSGPYLAPVLRIICAQHVVSCFEGSAARGELLACLSAIGCSVGIGRDGAPTARDFLNQTIAKHVLTRQRRREPALADPNGGGATACDGSGNWARYGEFIVCTAELDHHPCIALIAHEDGTDYRSVRTGLPVFVGTRKQGRTDMSRMKTFGALAGLALLAACAKTPETTATAPVAPASTIVPGSQEDLVANVGDRVFFDFDKSSLRDDGKATLDKQADWLSKYPTVNVQVAGNTDERGTEEYNLALGQRRANSAASYLKAKGVAEARIATISFGKDRPVAMGSDEQAWAQNRNATTSVR
jgi:peptidoglycan-associated lipoprotein